MDAKAERELFRAIGHIEAGVQHIPLIEKKLDKHIKECDARLDVVERDVAVLKATGCGPGLGCDDKTWWDKRSPKQKVGVGAGSLTLATAIIYLIIKLIETLGA